MDEFQVHRDAAGKFTGRKKKIAPKVSPVKVTKVHAETMKLARDLAKGRDVHLVLGTGKDAGSVYIVNGSEDGL